MAKLNFTISGEGVEPISATATLLPQDIPRIFAYLASTEYGTVQLEDGTEQPATPEQAAKAFASGIIQGLLSQVVRWERDEAARVAAASILEISLG